MSPASSRRRERRRQEFELLGESEHGPGEATCPCGERRVALLGARAPVSAVCGVEQALVRDAPPDVERAAATAVEHVVGRRRARVLQQPGQQVHLRVLFLDQAVAQLVRERKRTQRTDRVHEQQCAPLNEWMNPLPGIGVHLLAAPRHSL